MLLPAADSPISPSVYNLKRRIASLSPISLGVFQEQVLAFRTRSKAAETDASVGRACGVCQKTYDSHKAYQSHLKSQEHALKITNPGTSDWNTGEDKTVQTHGTLLSDGSDVATFPKLGDDSTTDEPLAVSQCLFCNSNSSTLERNLEHMYKQHGLFIPNQDHLYDMASLLGYLHSVISDFHACIYCETNKATTKGIQQHMIDKGHCMINLDEDSELDDFYDYPTTSSDSESESANATTTTEDDDGDQRSHRRSTQGSFTISEHESLRLSTGKTLTHRSQPRSHHRSHLPPPPAQRISEPTPSCKKPLTEPSPTRSTTTTSQSQPRPRRGQQQQQQIATHAPTTTTTNNNSISTVAKGLTNVPEQQQRALRALEQKILKLQVRARNEYQWGVQRGANRQKRYRVSALDGRFRVKDPR